MNDVASLQSLIDSGELAPTERAKHEVEVAEGVTVTTYTRELTDIEFRKILGARENYDRADLIAATYLRDDGKRLFKSKEQAGSLAPRMARALEALALKVNGLTDEAKAEAGNE
jgi:hypothetical protein